MKIEDLKVGDKVDYSSVIGMGITSRNHEIIQLKNQPNNFGCDVAWLTDKSGCVDVEHLSLI